MHARRIGKSQRRHHAARARRADHATGVQDVGEDATRTAQRWPLADTEVFVVDTLGELMGFFACASVAFVGGSLQPIGGHNLLEPAAMATASRTRGSGKLSSSTLVAPASSACCS